MSGVVGVLATGIAASTTIDPLIQYEGLLSGSARLLGLQVLAIGVAGVWTLGVSIVLAVAVKRMQRGDYAAGLDMIDHRMRATEGDREDDDVPILGLNQA